MHNGVCFVICIEECVCVCVFIFSSSTSLEGFHCRILPFF